MFPQSDSVFFGTMTSNDEVYNSVTQAFKAGYKFFDFAERYNNQKEIGRAIRHWFRENPDENRSDYFFQSKVWIDDIDANNTRRAINKIIMDLGLDYIDSILIHRPSLDINKSVVAWGELIEHKKLGLIKHIGVSNFDKDQILLLWSTSGVKPEMNQIEFSPFNQRWDRVTFCKKNEINVQAYGSFKGCTESKKLQKIAAEMKVNEFSIVKSWLAFNEINPIIKSTNPVNIENNLTSKNIEFSKEQYLKIFNMNVYKNIYSEGFESVFLSELREKINKDIK